MSETVLAIDLKVTCADHGTHEGVTMKVIDERVVYVTPDGEELKGDCCVKTIDGGSFLMPLTVIAAMIEEYRRQE